MDSAQNKKSPGFIAVSSDAASIAGEPLAYPNTPAAVISSCVLSSDPGSFTEWMILPVPPYIYVLEGTLSVKFAADGKEKKFNHGEAFLQNRSHWHRASNDTETD